MSETVFEVGGHRTHELTALLLGLLWGGAIALGLGWNMLDQPVWQTAIAVVGGFLAGLVAGWISWLFTRYVIDDEEIRIERGVLFRTSRRIPFARLQSVDINEPFIARLFGLCELTLEMAGGSNSRSQLRFLNLYDAKTLRRLLLAKAHGQAAVEPETHREVLHVVPPIQVIVGTLLSLDFLATLSGASISAAAAIVIDHSWASLGVALTILFPAAFALAQMISDRVLAQWGFTVSRDQRGLRIERGLLSRSSQVIPYDRVQGIAVVGPLAWRFYGWARLDVETAGYGSNSSKNGGVSATTLLPIANRVLALRLLNELMPDPDRGSGEQIRTPRRAAFFAPLGWRYRWLAYTDRTATSATGWLTWRLSVVPRQKVQSVCLVQGPVERRLKLATLEVHSPDGPVRVRLKHLDPQAARQLTLELRSQPPLVASSASGSITLVTSREDNQPSGSATFLGEP